MNKAFNIAVKAQFPILQMQMAINREKLLHRPEGGEMVQEWEKRLPDLEDIFKLSDMTEAIPALEALMEHPLLRNTAPIDMLRKILVSWESNPSPDWVSPVTPDMLSLERTAVESLKAPLVETPVVVVPPPPPYEVIPIQLKLTVSEPTNWEISSDILTWEGGDTSLSFSLYKYPVDFLGVLKLGEGQIQTSTSSHTHTTQTQYPYVGGSAYRVKQDTPAGEVWSNTVFMVPCTFVTDGSSSGLLSWSFDQGMISEGVYKLNLSQVIETSKLP